MGLEGVEIVMAVEDAFDITLSDTDAGKVRAPRDLIELVMGKVGRSDVAVCLTQRAFHRLRRAFLSELGLKRAEFNLDMAADRLLPVEARKTMLAEIYRRVGIAAPPMLIRSRRLKALLAAATLAAGAGVGTAFALASPGKSILLNFIRELYWMAGLAAAICVLRLGCLLTNNMRTAFPERLRTVRGHVRWVVAINPQLIGGPPGQWSRKQVSEIVREIVTEHLGDKNYREDARFVEDLGMD